MTSTYHSYNYYIKETFSSRIYKVAFEAGFTCPNINGTLASGGCLFFDNKTSFPNSRVSLLLGSLYAVPVAR